MVNIFAHNFSLYNIHSFIVFGNVASLSVYLMLIQFVDDQVLNV